MVDLRRDQSVDQYGAFICSFYSWDEVFVVSWEVGSFYLFDYWEYFAHYAFCKGTCCKNMFLRGFEATLGAYLCFEVI